jgi:hypothetical protein
MRLARETWAGLELTKPKVKPSEAVFALTDVQYYL